MRRLRRAQQRHAKEQKKFRRRVLTTGAAAAIAFGAGISLNKALAQYKPDNHQLPTIARRGAIA